MLERSGLGGRQGRSPVYFPSPGAAVAVAAVPEAWGDRLYWSAILRSSAEYISAKYNRWDEYLGFYYGAQEYGVDH